MYAHRSLGVRCVFAMLRDTPRSPELLFRPRPDKIHRRGHHTAHLFHYPDLSYDIGHRGRTVRHFDAAARTERLVRIAQKIGPARLSRLALCLNYGSDRIFAALSDLSGAIGKLFYSFARHNY